MKKSAFILLLIFGGGLLLAIFCFLSDDGVQQNHEAFCASGHFLDVSVMGAVSFFALFFAGFFLLLNSIFVPQRFVHTLFRPPQPV